jgi:hypothetical protein
MPPYDGILELNQSAYLKGRLSSKVSFGMTPESLLNNIHDKPTLLAGVCHGM